MTCRLLCIKLVMLSSFSIQSLMNASESDDNQLMVSADEIEVLKTEFGAARTKGDFYKARFLMDCLEVRTYQETQYNPDRARIVKKELYQRIKLTDTDRKYLKYLSSIPHDERCDQKMNAIDWAMARLHKQSSSTHDSDMILAYMDSLFTLQKQITKTKNQQTIKTPVKPPVLQHRNSLEKLYKFFKVRRKTL